MSEFLAYGFVQRALAVGILLAGTCAVLSFFVVLKRMSFVGVGLSHAALGGVALGVVLISLSPTYRQDLMAYLFGNILSVRQGEVLPLAALSAVSRPTPLPTRIDSVLAMRAVLLPRISLPTMGRRSSLRWNW